MLFKGARRIANVHYSQSKSLLLECYKRSKLGTNNVLKR